jgi:D-alanyl-D-alanine carboxypeptidase (penicillin-binding protein 5/6)
VRSLTRTTLAIGAVGALALGLVGVPAGPASAETVGGDLLDRTTRTVDLLPGGDPLPDIWAETWIIADAETGEVLAHKGAHVPRPPASTLKTLTALTVLPQTSPQDRYVATERAAGIYGARVGLRPGKAYALEDLWHAVFLPSANDAAIAVAEANGGVRRTVRQMNRTARLLGAHDTVARNTSGLDAPGQVSSAYDLALIARAGFQREDFARYAGLAKATFPDVRGKGRHPIYTTNRLLLHGYRGLLGGKTGFTTQAGRTYVAVAERRGTRLVIALMGIKESTEDAARKLLDWGFANHDSVEPVGVLVSPAASAAETAPSTATPTAGATSPAGDLPAATEAAPATRAPSALTEAAVWGGALALLAAGVGLVAARRGRRRVRP